MKNNRVTLSLAILGACFVFSGVALGQTKQLKAPSVSPQTTVQPQQAPESQRTVLQNVPEGTNSYSVVIESRTTDDGKILQSKKVWSNGTLVQEEEKELDANDPNNSFNATIQLPNGQITSGGIFLSEDDQDVFGGITTSPLDSIRRIEEQLRRQQERMREQFEALRNQISDNSQAFSLNNSNQLQGLKNLQPKSSTPSKYWLGMTISVLPEILVNHLPVNENEGVLVNYVVPDSPAHKLGLKLYDVVYSINGVVVSSPAEVTDLVEKIGAQKVKVEYYRKGKLEVGEIEIAERPQTLESQMNFNPPHQNKMFQVVRPGLIVPSQELSTDTSTESDSSTEENKSEIQEDTLDKEKTSQTP